MKLSEIFAKLKQGAKDLFGDKTSTELTITKPTRKKRKYGGYCITIKENKGSVLIKCWNCGKELWVRKGSPCHDKGLCGRCVY
jgi:hypothetical protein